MKKSNTGKKKRVNRPLELYRHSIFHFYVYARKHIGKYHVIDYTNDLNRGFVPKVEFERDFKLITPLERILHGL